MTWDYYTQTVTEETVTETRENVHECVSVFLLLLFFLN